MEPAHSAFKKTTCTTFFQRLVPLHHFNPASRPGPQTVPECRFDKSNAKSFKCTSCTSCTRFPSDYRIKPTSNGRFPATRLPNKAHPQSKKTSNEKIPPCTTTTLGRGLCLCLRVTKKAQSGFSKTNDRVKAKDHRPQGIPVVVWWGAHSAEGEKLDERHYRVPSLSPKRSNQAWRPGSPPKPLSN